MPVLFAPQKTYRKGTEKSIVWASGPTFFHVLTLRFYYALVSLTEESCLGTKVITQWGWILLAPGQPRFNPQPPHMKSSEHHQESTLNIAGVAQKKKSKEIVARPSPSPMILGCPWRGLVAYSLYMAYKP